jgi:hypothetical protein
MANTKVSQLPEYSGNPTGGYSVFNNSGETTTYKIKNYNLFGANNTDAGSIFPFFVGSGNTAGGGVGATHIIGIGNNISAGASRGDNGGCMAVGHNNTNTDPYAGNSLVVGQDNTGNGHNSIVFGRYNSVPYGYAGMVGGYQNTSNNEGGIIVSQNGTINGFNNAMLGGRFNQLLGYAGGIGGTENNGMLGGYYNNLTGGIQSSIIGGQYNLISGQQFGDLDRCYYSSILGGNNNNIGQFVTGSTIIGSAYSTISGTSATTINSNILGGSNNIIGSLSNVQMIGCSDRTATASATTYVENLRVFRQAQYGNYDNGSRATNYTIDWDNGNIQKVILTGSCVFSATNITDGTTYIFKVEQDNSGNRAATWSSGIFKFANSTPPTLSTGANDVDIFTFVAMDGLLYGVAQLNFG